MFHILEELFLGVEFKRSDFSFNSRFEFIEIFGAFVDFVTTSSTSPCIVNVFPVLVGPYTKMVQFWPFKKALQREGPLISAKT